MPGTGEPDAVTALHDEIARRADEFETARRLPDDVARRMARSGMFRLLVAERYGGAEAVEGGYRVSGRWPFGSGCQISSWICGGCLILTAKVPTGSRRTLAERPATQSDLARARSLVRAARAYTAEAIRVAKPTCEVVGKVMLGIDPKTPI